MGRIIGVISAMVLVAGVAGCNTLAGVGEDVSAGGQVITEAAEG